MNISRNIPVTKRQSADVFTEMWDENSFIGLCNLSKFEYHYFLKNRITEIRFGLTLKFYRSRRRRM